MKRILFVDDEPNVLRALRDLLYKQRHAWNMVFVAGGEDALAELRKAPFDVIVTDMRMPGMDGAMLLERVKAEYPGVARVVLSGYADLDSVMRTVPVAHQYLSKPCDPQQLSHVIDRLCRLQALFGNESLRQVVGSLDKLPSVPRTYSELSQALSNPDTGIPEVAAIVERDPAMSLKLLQLSNSAFFGLGKRVTAVAQAVSYIGLELVKGLALTNHVFAAMEKAPPVAGFSLDELQRASVITARVAKRLLPLDAKQAADAFTAGIVHDIGQIVLATGAREQYARALQATRGSGRPVHHAELEVLGVTHAEIGAYLLGMWGLPPLIVEAVARHHDASMLQSELGVAAALHVAVSLVDREMGKCNGPDEEIEAALLQRMGCSEELTRWRGIAQSEVMAAGGPSAAGA